MRLAEPEGNNKSVREKASGYKVREVGVDLEGKYCCYEMEKNPTMVGENLVRGTKGALREDVGGLLGDGEGKVALHCTDSFPILWVPRSQHPIDFPAECEVRQEAGTCQFSLVQKSDPRLPCKGGGPDPEWGSANTPVPGAPAPHSG